MSRYDANYSGLGKAKYSPTAATTAHSICKLSPDRNGAGPFVWFVGIYVSVKITANDFSCFKQH
jgi:hypothetical protein